MDGPLLYEVVELPAGVTALLGQRYDCTPPRWQILRTDGSLESRMGWQGSFATADAAAASLRPLLSRPPIEAWTGRSGGAILRCFIHREPDDAFTVVVLENGRPIARRTMTSADESIAHVIAHDFRGLLQNRRDRPIGQADSPL